MSDTNKCEDGNETVVGKSKSEKIINGQQERLRDEAQLIHLLNQVQARCSSFDLTKIDTLVDSCCTNKCFENISFEDQVKLFSKFQSIQSKSLQDSHLASCMEKSDGPKRQTSNPKKPRENIWKYVIYVDGTKVGVCKKFLVNIFQTSEKRLRVVQSKLLSNDSFEEKRGTHRNRPKSIPENVILLMGEHLKSIPHDGSTPLYFDVSMMRIKSLFEMFKDYYKEKTKTDLKMSYKTYYGHFKAKFSHAVQKPKAGPRVGVETKALVYGRSEP